MDLKIVFFIVILVNFVTAEPARGDPCFDKETDLKGTCKYAADCAKITTGVLDLPRCAFEGNKGVFCCPDLPVEQEQNETKTDSRIAGAIAKEKCKEYSKYVKTITPSAVPLLGAADMITNECLDDVSALVIGGTAASRKEFPHMVLIGYDVKGLTRWNCGGSLISEEFVLTAAHCISDRQLGDAKFAKMGFVDKEDDPNVQKFDIVERIRHPDYSEGYKDYDIGLIKLHHKADLNAWVRPACLYTESVVREPKAIATGWGNVGSEMQSQILLKVDLEFFDPNSCHKYYKSLTTFRVIEENLIVCAGSKKEIKDTCRGDSGGPLQIYHKENGSTVSCMFDIVGVTSHGYDCTATLHIPAVYTRVSQYVKWIEDIVWPSS